MREGEIVEGDEERDSDERDLRERQGDEGLKRECMPVEQYFLEQATVFSEKGFWMLWLPGKVAGDIWRSYVSQRLAVDYGLRIAFVSCSLNCSYTPMAVDEQKALDAHSSKVVAYLQR